jgi:predicted PurR-regulated permease PerM
MLERGKEMRKSNTALNIVLFFVIVSILRAGQNIFLPFVLALFLWALIWLLDSAFDGMFARIGAPRLAKWLSRPFSIVTIFGIFYFIIAGLASNIGDVSASFALYQRNLSSIMARLSLYFGFDVAGSVDVPALVDKADIPRLMGRSFQGVAALASSIAMVLLYLVFMLLEEKSIRRKFPLVFSNSARLKEARQMMGKILGKIKTYLFTKTLTSLATAVGGYAIMRYVGLDFALFWAILFFLCNFIPTIGSIAASAFPIALSLIQFPDTFAPFLVCLFSISALQVAIGSILEPRIMGRQINISPLVQITSLVVWGYIWGVMGMFLCVPILIILTIVLYNIPSTKHIAILMSENGESI